MADVIPLAIMKITMKRRFVYKNNWDANKRANYILCWRLQDNARWLFGITNISLCIILVLTWLANVRIGAHWDWLTGAVTVLVEFFLLHPFAEALMYAVLAWLIAWLMPDVIPYVGKELLRDRDQMEAELKEQDLLDGVRSMTISSTNASSFTVAGVRYGRSKSNLQEPNPTSTMDRPVLTTARTMETQSAASSRLHSQSAASSKLHSEKSRPIPTEFESDRPMLAVEGLVDIVPRLIRAETKLQAERSPCATDHQDCRVLEIECSEGIALHIASCEAKLQAEQQPYATEPLESPRSNAPEAAVEIVPRMASREAKLQAERQACGTEPMDGTVPTTFRLEETVPRERSREDNTRPAGFDNASADGDAGDQDSRHPFVVKL
eukprot:gnl/TRDRNA2_/TRDRNA2_173552_c9_seq3.p1 gnl/TRDRNA2_/TRDRNA2_173552_c9~~gnl/TRDRNA2_/TRDRNA2_173552_c9_seq3.p1  ORF type:complete len:436 (+),score=53.78 gnl/TRDRNA2_/TRDRNA2_173552_c9_seq3:170-1309(+)